MANLLYPVTTGHNVDDKYSPLVEPNLFAGNVFQPGVTFTDKYQIGPAGQIMVHKPGKSTITVTTPGNDFSDAIVQDSLITISLDKEIKDSRKMYGVTAASVSYDTAAAELEMALGGCREAWNIEAAKAIVTADGVRVVKNVTVVSADSTIYDEIVDARQVLRGLKAHPDTIIVSPTVYGKLLKSEKFQRSVEIDNSVIRDAYVGRIAGLNVYEYEDLGSAVGNITNANGESTADITWQAGTDELEYIIYDSDALSIVTSVEAIRVVQEPTRFVGSLAQVQLVSGFKLTNPNRAILKIHDSSATVDLT